MISERRREHCCHCGSSPMKKPRSWPSRRCAGTPSTRTYLLLLMDLVSGITSLPSCIGSIPHLPMVEAFIFPEVFKYFVLSGKQSWYSKSSKLKNISLSR